MIIILFFIFNCHSEEAVDLGNIEVQGELRRPSVDYVSTNKKFDKMIQETIILNFYQLEKKLTEINTQDYRERYMDD